MLTQPVVRANVARASSFGEFAGSTAAAIPAGRQSSRRAQHERAQAHVSRLAVGAATAYVAALPLLRPSGPFNTSPVDVAGVILIAAVVPAWLAGRFSLRLPFAAPIAIFATGGVLGALAGPIPRAGLLAVAQDLVLLMVCGCIATISTVADVRRHVLRTWAVAGSGWAAALIVGVIGHISVLAGGGARYGVRATLTMGDPNIAGNYFVASIFIVLASRWPTRQPFRAVVVLMLAAAVFLTGSNGALVAALVGSLAAGITALCMRRGWSIFAGLTALAAAAVLVFALAPIANWQQDIGAAAQASSVHIVRDSFGREQQSVDTRQTLLTESLKLFREGGPLGTGPGSTKPRLEAKQFAYPKEAHDDYLAALVERGALGVLGLALLLAAVVHRVAAVVRRSRSVRTGPARAPGIASSAAMVGGAVVFATSGMFYEVLHFRHLWVFLAVLASMSMGKRVERVR